MRFEFHNHGNFFKANIVRRKTDHLPQLLSSVEQSRHQCSFRQCLFAFVVTRDDWSASAYPSWMPMTTRWTCSEKANRKSIIISWGKRFFEFAIGKKINVIIFCVESQIPNVSTKPLRQWQDVHLFVPTVFFLCMRGNLFRIFHTKSIHCGADSLIEESKTNWCMLLPPFTNWSFKNRDRG